MAVIRASILHAILLIPICMLKDLVLALHLPQDHFTNAQLILPGTTMILLKDQKHQYIFFYPDNLGQAEYHCILEL
jgi:hypothetical protein